MLAYVTGGAGFVGKWLTEHLSASGDSVVAVDAEVDVTSPTATRDSLRSVQPEVVYHLAGLAHVGRSWEDPGPTFTVNALGTLNVLEGAAACDSPPRVIVVSSAEVYGAAGSAPVGEETPLRPVSPYAASKVAAEFLALQAFLGRGLPAIRVRPFNHVGPGQAPDFVVSALARRIVEAERAGGGRVAVGNLEAERDFTDVRDVVRSYRLLAERGVPGEVYNVASGRSVRVKEVADRLVALAECPIRLETDPDLVRPIDVPVFLGDARKLAGATGWSPAIPLDETLADVLEYWRSRPSG
ncbi:MAG: GDP-mannose 4,6-dehydratase [Acidimicrobiales bacterium]|jgi:GDP-4-dehydro-6-deoxy-D-mannose reductase